MNPDISSTFGRYRPSPFFSALISLAQNVPYSWVGKKFARLVRRLVLKRVQPPIDISVGDIKMRCYLHDNLSEKKFVFMPWRFDERERQFLAEMLPKNGVFIDIGANVGIYTLTTAMHLGSLGRIVALEPNPPAFARLRFNIEATEQGRLDWPRIDTLQIGVGDATEERDLFLDPTNLGGSSIATHSEGAVRISCKPLLDILAELSIERVDALKIDIEGAEDIALIPYLTEAPDEKLPLCMIIENSEHLWRFDLLGALSQRGYQVEIRSRMNTVYRRIPSKHEQ